MLLRQTVEVSQSRHSLYILLSGHLLFLFHGYRQKSPFRSAKAERL